MTTVRAEDFRPEAGKIEGRFVVKVQLPLFGPWAAGVLAYNEDRTIEWIETLPDRVTEIRKLVKGKPKTFWFATIQDGFVVLGEPAPWQEW